MRTFIIRSRKGPTNWQKISSHIGKESHIEILAHVVINAFFLSNGFRQDVEVYLILESSADFPRTIKLSANEGLSLSGFHEQAVFDVIINALKCSHVAKDTTQFVAPGVEISGFGFEKLVTKLSKTRAVYLLAPKGEDIRTTTLADNPVFILSDHLALPKNNIKSLQRQGIKTLSLGKAMLFASQCVILLNHELDIK